MGSSPAGGDGADGLARRLEAAEALARVGTYELRDGKFVACSPEFLRIHGFAEDGPPTDLDEVLLRVGEEDRELLHRVVVRSLESGTPYTVEYSVLRPNGTVRSLRGHGTVRQDESGARVLFGAAQDVTENELAVSRLVAAESRYSAIVEHANDGIWILNRSGATTFVNRRTSELLGYPAAELLGQPPSAFSDDQLPDMADERRTHFECRFRRKDGDDVWTATSLSQLPESHGGGILLVLTDITARKRMEDRLRHAAERDALTGLMNRSRFEELLDELLGQDSGSLAMLFLDLDHFKYVNDSFGHSVGDALLREVADCLRDLVRGEDVVGRFAGDEFVLALPSADRETAVAVAERILATIRSRRWQKLSRLTASVGVACATRGRATTRPELMVAADTALHEAKSNGRDQFALYSGPGGRGFQWVDELRAALEEDRLLLHGQAIVPAIPDGRRRYELLLRMRDRDGTIVPPGLFIPAAEQFGMMREIDRWVIAQALTLARRGIAVEVNLSGASLGDAEIRARVDEAVAAGVRPELLTFEVTETAAARNLEAARDFAVHLRRLGCAFALDDFGTGFGSLLYLKHLPVSELKIDIEFVRDLVRSEADQRLVRAIVQMAQPLGLTTVAEGVEDEATLELLREIGVDYVQGFGIDKPTLVNVHNGVGSDGAVFAISTKRD